MLNISNNQLSKGLFTKKYSTLAEVESNESGNALKRLLYISFFICVVILFIPWTQNIRAPGSITSLKPQQKPQSITTIIGGRINKWYVIEGDFVKEGDTIVSITEIKDKYFDTNLLERTKNQIDFKKQAIVTYTNKLINLDEQLKILKNQRNLKLTQSKIKLRQAELKTQSDSIAYEAAKVNLNIAEYQLKRTDTLYKSGLKSLTDLEKRRLKKQQVEAYKVKAENVWLNSLTTLTNLKIEISNVSIKYDADANKIQSLKLATLKDKVTAQSELNKLEIQYSNFKYRNGLYYILAPQSGYVTKTNIGGVGEIVKEGQEVFSLMPETYELAAEIYIDPVDLPLVKIGEHVRIQFDGWPAIVFSGWPGLSHGTYGGEVYAIDRFISANGKYRVLVKQDNEYNWPEALRFGGGVSAMLLLNDVPIWYELWRNVNGFPPDYYTGKLTNKAKKDKK
ncbi:MAG TPA: HlyD family efflux transporter periplasmic adaptor subunit [Crocinitomix sp.]|nr:HlyD family efflux transporter periplasmic adaptor subunit [Crocinitomix sp.]